LLPPIDRNITGKETSSNKKTKKNKKKAITNNDYNDKNINTLRNRSESRRLVKPKPLSLKKLNYSDKKSRSLLASISSGRDTGHHKMAIHKELLELKHRLDKFHTSMIKRHEWPALNMAINVYNNNNNNIINDDKNIVENAKKIVENAKKKVGQRKNKKGSDDDMSNIDDGRAPTDVEKESIRLDYIENCKLNPQFEKSKRKRDV